METKDLFKFPSKSAVLSMSTSLGTSRIAVLNSPRIISILPRSQTENPESELRLSFDCADIKLSPPEFGSLIAASDLKGGLHIFEEDRDPDGKSIGWKSLKEFSFPEEKITSFEFSPGFLPPQIAVSTSFGILRVFQSINPMDFSDWRLICEETVSVSSNGIKAISWGKNPFVQGTLAVLCETAKTKGPKTVSDVHLYMNFGDSWKFIDILERQDHYSSFGESITWANNLGKTYETLVCGGKDGVAVWSFWLENANGKIDVKMRRRGTVELRLAAGEVVKRVDSSPNGKLFSCVDDRNSVFLCKEMNDQWVCLYKFIAK